MKQFIKDAMSLNIDDFIRYEIDGTHYTIAITADKDGFNCELLYSASGVEDIQKHIFVNKDKKYNIQSVIETFMIYIEEDDEDEE